MTTYSESFQALQNALENARVNAIIYGELLLAKSEELQDIPDNSHEFTQTAIDPLPDAPTYGEMYDPSQRAAIESQVESEVGNLTGQLLTGLDALAAEYFPGLTSGFSALPEDTLTALLDGSDLDPAQLASSVSKVWEQAYIELERSSDRERDNVVRLFSSSGFTVPPGALVERLAAIERTRTEELNKAVRAQAIAASNQAVSIYTTALSVSASLKTSMTGQLMGQFSTLVSAANTRHELGFRDRDLAMRARVNVANIAREYYAVETAYARYLIELEQARAGTEVDFHQLEIDRYRANTEPEALARLSEAYVSLMQSITTSMGTLAADFG